MAKLIIEGNSFLWHMVRNIIAVLKAVGRNQIEPEIITQMLKVDENT